MTFGSLECVYVGQKIDEAFGRRVYICERGRTNTRVTKECSERGRKYALKQVLSTHKVAHAYQQLGLSMY
jgi:hypothetical protein